jgi:sugar lactone lactonase YvrE
MPDERDDGRALDRFWNDLVAGRGDKAAHAIAPETSETVRAFQTLAQASPEKASCDRVDRAVFAAIERTGAQPQLASVPDELVVTTAPSHTFGTNGSGTPASLQATSRRLGWGGASGAVLASAALVLLTLVGSYVLFGGSLRPQGEESQHTMLPALAGTLEHVWTSAGGPPVSSPYGLGIDPQGDLWVSDASNDRFQILAPDGTYVETWGTPGDAEGEFEFYSPHTDFGTPYGDAAFDAAGNIYVIDTGNFRVQKFAPDRTFLLAWGSEGEDDGQFLGAGSIAVGGDGTVYVADETRHDVQKFDGQGRWLATIGSEGYEAGQFRVPAGVTVGAGGDIWVADFGNNRIQRLSPDGEPLDAWGILGGAEGELNGPSDVAVDTLGRVYVADTFNHRLQVFAEDGRFLAEVDSSPGSGPLPYVAGVVVTTDGVVVAAHKGGVEAYRLLLPAGDELMN